MTQGQRDYLAMLLANSRASVNPFGWDQERIGMALNAYWQSHHYTIPKKRIDPLSLYVALIQEWAL